MREACTRAKFRQSLHTQETNHAAYPRPRISLNVMIENSHAIQKWR